jgi:hypothetical protein
MYCPWQNTAPLGLSQSAEHSPAAVVAAQLTSHAMLAWTSHEPPQAVWHWAEQSAVGGTV